MGALPAYRQARPGQMPGGNGQNRLGNAMVDGQLDINLGDGDVTHDARARNVEKLVVGLQVGTLGKLAVVHERVLEPGDSLVVGIGRLEPLRIVLLREALHRGVVVHDGMRLHPGVPPVAERGVYQQSEAQDEHPKEHDAGEMLFHGPPFDDTQLVKK